MPRTRNPYPSEYKEKLIALAHRGRSVESLARELEPCAATIQGWLKQSKVDDGSHPNSLTSEERDELRREVKQLRQERNIFSKAAAWFVQGELTSPRPSNL